MLSSRVMINEKKGAGAVLNEKRLSARLAAGDSRALSEIIKTYSAYVCTIAANITSPPLQPEDVEEIAADAFLALWNHAGQVEEGKLKAYLAAVTRNLAKNKLRNLHLSVPLEEDYMILSSPDLEEEMLKKDVCRLTRQAADELPEPDRSIFRRYYFLYQKTEEIAAALELSPAAVRQRLSRGREKLKSYLEERGISCEDCGCGYGR